eukprot:354188-Chlamydomonas_euryale.AAC.1
MAHAASRGTVAHDARGYGTERMQQAAWCMAPGARVMRQNALACATQRSGPCNTTLWPVQHNALARATQRSGPCNTTAPPSSTHIYTHAGLPGGGRARALFHGVAH